MKTLETLGFDYSSLDKDTAGKLQYFSKTGHMLVRKNMIRFIAEFGEVLSDARKLLADHHEGTFCKWATAEFDTSRQTVYNYVNAWDRVLSNGWTTLANISPTALYLLANDTTPKPVRDKVLRIAVKQEAVTKSDVTKLLSAGGKGAKSPPPPQPEPNEPIDADSEPVADEEDPLDTPEIDYGKCPVCTGTKWNAEDPDEVFCAKCHQPHGEPAGDVDEDRINTQRQKTVKTAEALMRAFDDLQYMKARQGHAGAIKFCKELITIAKEWK